MSLIAFSAGHCYQSADGSSSGGGGSQMTRYYPTGQWGPASDLTLAVRSSTPKGHVVFALSWDSPADLDLHLVAPNGKELSSKTPTSALPDAGAVVASEHDAVLQGDSNASCVDGARAEYAVVQDTPAPGTWRVYVDEFDACAAAATTFTLTVLVDGAEVSRTSGRLLDIEASGGSRPDGQAGPLGLWVTSFQF